MAVIEKDLGPVSAYAVAVAHGYTGTEAEWEALIANSAINAQSADASATAAAASAQEATQQKTQAQAQAAAAQAHALDASRYAQNAGQANSYAQMASSNAAVSAANASNAQTAAEAAQAAAEAAVTGAEAAQAAAEAAVTDAQTAKTAAETAAATAAAAYGTDLLADDYSTSKTYAVGDYVIYSGNLYRCTTAITTAEAWTAAHWTQAQIGPDVSDLKSAFDNQVGVAVAQPDNGIYGKTQFPDADGAVYEKTSDAIGKYTMTFKKPTASYAFISPFLGYYKDIKDSEFLIAIKNTCDYPVHYHLLFGRGPEWGAANTGTIINEPVNVGETKLYKFKLSQFNTESIWPDQNALVFLIIRNQHGQNNGQLCSIECHITRNGQNAQNAENAQMAEVAKLANRATISDSSDVSNDTDVKILTEKNMTYVTSGTDYTIHGPFIHMSDEQVELPSATTATGAFMTFNVGKDIRNLKIYAKIRSFSYTPVAGANYSLRIRVGGGNGNWNEFGQNFVSPFNNSVILIDLSESTKSYVLDTTIDHFIMLGVQFLAASGTFTTKPAYNFDLELICQQSKTIAYISENADLAETAKTAIVSKNAGGYVIDDKIDPHSVVVGTPTSGSAEWSQDNALHTITFSDGLVASGQFYPCISWNIKPLFGIGAKLRVTAKNRNENKTGWYFNQWMLSTQASSWPGPARLKSFSPQTFGGSDTAASSTFEIDIDEYFSDIQASSYSDIYFLVACFSNSPDGSRDGNALSVGIDVIVDEGFVVADVLKDFNKTDYYTKPEVDAMIDTTPPDVDLLVWGDSLTAGAGGQGTTYIGVCASRLGGKTYRNCGVGGETANTIAARQGGSTIIIPAGNINGTYPYDTFKDMFGGNIRPLRQGNGSNSGNVLYINGQECSLSISQSSSTSTDATYTISGYTGGASAVPLYGRFRGSEFTGKVVVIFVGQNGQYCEGASDIITSRMAIIDSMISHIGHERYVIIGISSGDEATNASQDNRMLAKYGNKFLPARRLISAYGMAINGLTPTSDDETAIAAGKVPPSLLSDAIHMNAYGYTALGTLLADQIRALGYFD